MGVTSRRRAIATVALAAATVLALASGCSSTKKPSTNTSPDSNKKITLTVDVFGTFGYTEAGLYKKYQDLHPNVTIVERGTGIGLGDENTKLTQWMAANGAGAGDIVALEEGTITQFKGIANQFANLLDYGAGSLQSNFLPWKWEEGMTSDGKLLGLGTDVGSMAMCYRSDLFAKAGLPTDPAQVAALWPDWNAFITAGQKFEQKSGGVKFVDAATNLYNTVLMQTAGNDTGYTYFDKSDNLVLDKNADIKTAWDTTVKMMQAGLSAGYTSFSDDWTAGFKSSKFATVACPAWMLGVIQGNAGDSLSGKWNVTKSPGNGGNWGGSFLAVPKNGPNVAAAADLAKFLTSPDSQLAVFQKEANLPSAQVLYNNPDFLATKNAYFSNAPIGQIFGPSAASLKPVYLGAKNQPVRTAVENALLSVEQGKRTPDQAWQDALKNGAAAAAS
jgi:cellobiose transport system substrate-binding protein